MIGNGDGKGDGSANGPGQSGNSGAAPPTRLRTPDRGGDFRPRRPTDPMAAPPAHAGESSVTIDVLHMRVQAHNAAAGRSIAEEAVRQVADRLPAGLTGRIPALKLRVRPRRAGAAGARDAIADTMLEILTLHGRGER
jgi:hypothetical protein